MGQWRGYWQRVARILVAVSVGLVLALSTPLVGITQDAPPPASPAPTPAPGAEPSGQQVFFADVLVRGQPVLQVGSLDDLSATDRAQQISRRIAGLIQQPQPLDAVQVNVDESRNLATLQLNNRVIMTVTAQDALDFDTTVETLAQRWAAELDEALAQPNLAVDVIRRLEGTVEQFVRSILSNLPSILGAVLVMFFTWLVAMAVSRGAYIWAEQTEGDRSTEILISRLSYGAVWLLGGVVALGVLGLSFTTLLGTLGLTSVAIGFGLKDILSNYLSGVILLAARPFRIGDEVVIGQYEGRVIQIQLRVTTVQTYDGRQVYIPNQEVFQSSITNNTASPMRRSSVMVGIDYDADIEQAEAEIYQAITHIDGVEHDPIPIVLVQELAASTVNLEILFFVNSRRKSFLDVTSEVRRTIKERLQLVGIEMPTDIYTLTFRDTPPAKPLSSNQAHQPRPSQESPRESDQNRHDGRQSPA